MKACPVCDMEGVYFYTGHRGVVRLAICKYCRSSWAVERWRDGEWQAVPAEQVNECIEQNKEKMRAIGYRNDKIEGESQKASECPAASTTV